MDALLKGFLILLIFSGVFGASIDPECTNSGTSTDGLIDNGIPQKVLYVTISEITSTESCWPNHCYMWDMHVTGGNMVRDAVAKAPGSTLTKFLLHPNAPLDMDLNQYDQIWVNDLSAYENNARVQMEAYQKIANWWKNKGKPHLICDGRWISSIWTYPSVVGAQRTIFGYPPNAFRPNNNLAENYFFNLKIRGGGLVLLTDHADAFVRGINYINDYIGINRFSGFFYSEPYLMEADQQSSLLSWPTEATHHEKDGVHYLWDDSSTADAPYNQQPNGVILYPLGWHSSKSSGNPGLSTTIRGTVGFLISISSPSCDQRFQENSVVQLAVQVDKAGTPPYTFTWRSDLDGILGTGVTLSKTLSLGIHVITVTGVDSQRLVAEAKVRVHMVYESGQEMCYASMFNGNANVQEIFPIKRTLSDSSYYSYGKPVQGSSNTPDALEQTGTGQFFFYDDGVTLSLFHIFGAPGDISGGSVFINMNATQLANLATSITLRDDPNNQNFKWNKDGEGSALFQWKDTTTGFVLSPLPRDKSFCVNYKVQTSTETGVEAFVVRTHTKPSTANPNPNDITSLRSKATLLTSIDLCYSQCKCPNGKSYPLLTDSFNNHGVLFDANGNIGNYQNNANCSWVIDPVSPTNDDIWAITFYWDSFATSIEDKVSFFVDSILVGEYSGSTLPGTLNVEPGHPVMVVFASDSTGTDKGFDVTYWVLPQLLQLEPPQGPALGGIPVTVRGANFINSPTLGCLFDDIKVPAKFIDSKTIECVAPPHAVGEFNFEVTNDGKRYTDTTKAKPEGYGIVTFSWIENECALLSDCGNCLSFSSNCRWCNDAGNLTGPFCYSFNDATATCNPTSVDQECCTACIPFSGCSGNGQCACNNTCSCNEGYRNDDCGCKKCPAHPTNNTICSGLGECACNGTCSCEFGHQGAACECLMCGGLGEQCSGNGQCSCNGTCACDSDYEGEFCECSKKCPADCSGHGTCNCGVCECDVGYQLLPDCSCKDECPDDCSSHGDCNCDGTCACFEGYIGENCNTTSPCDHPSCEECLNDPVCGWCGDFSICENKFIPLKCTATLGFEFATECPKTAVVEDNDQNHIITGTVVGIGGAILLGAIAGVIFALKNKRETNELLLSGTNPFEAANYNPLYETNQSSGSNPFYEQQQN